METFLFIGIIAVSYVIGAIPMGLIIVKIITGKDIRLIQSGRTGGTNAMRAAGFWAGFSTAILDVCKGASGVWIARALLPGHPWLEILAPIAAIIGHNYSIFLLEKEKDGKIRLRGGAGGAPTAGGAIGLWFPSTFIIIPAATAILFGIGYASVATMSIPILASLIFAYRAWIGASPWVYVLYGLLAEVILVWALRPNIKRLWEGNERLVGWRARRKASQTENRNPKQ